MNHYRIQAADRPAMIAEYGGHCYETEATNLPGRLHLDSQHGVLVDVLADPTPSSDRPRAPRHLLRSRRPAGRR